MFVVLALSFALGVELVAGAKGGGSTGTTPETGGAVVFRESCTGQHYAMNPDGTARQVLDIGNRYVLDASRGPSRLTLLAGGAVNGSDPYPPHALYAIALTRESGAWSAEPAVLLLNPATDPLLGGNGAFSPDGNHIAYIYSGPYGPEVYIGDVVRDANGNVIDLTNITEVVALFLLGQRSDSSADDRFTFTGELDFTWDGRALVVTIYDDLWLLQLAADGHTLVRADPLTRTKDFAERGPSSSPMASVIAFYGGPFTTGQSGRGLYVDNMNIYTLDVAPGVVRQVTTRVNEGASGWGKSNPNWSPSGANLLYRAEGPVTKRTAPCGSFVNYDLFQIRADGTQKAVNVTNTTGTGVEDRPGWGW